MKWLRAWISVPLATLAVGVHVFRTNRIWLDRQMARKSVSLAFKGFITLTLLAWLLIWLFADDTYRENLNRAVKSYWSELRR